MKWLFRNILFNFRRRCRFQFFSSYPPPPTRARRQAQLNSLLLLLLLLHIFLLKKSHHLDPSTIHYVWVSRLQDRVERKNRLLWEWTKRLIKRLRENGFITMLIQYKRTVKKRRMILGTFFFWIDQSASCHRTRESFVHFGSRVYTYIHTYIQVSLDSRLMNKLKDGYTCSDYYSKKKMGIMLKQKFHSIFLHFDKTSSSSSSIKYYTK